MPPYQPSRLIRAVEYGTDWSHRIARPVRAFPDPNIEELLAHPSWSIRSLLPQHSTPTIAGPKEEATANTTADRIKPEDEVTREKLHHLLRLSALPLPKSKAEESHLLSTLRAQIHFVRSIQSVDTTHVKPLVAIRDETAEAREEQTVHVADLKPWFDLEEKVGKNGTVRRRKVERKSMQGKIVPGKEGQWDPFQLGVGSKEGIGRKMGRWFVVKKARAEKAAEAVKPG